MEVSPGMQLPALQRLVYEATIGDIVDVSIRMSSRSKMLQKQVRAMIVGTGVIGGSIFTAVWMFYLTSRTPVAIAIAGSPNVSC